MNGKLRSWAGGLESGRGIAYPTREGEVLCWLRQSQSACISDSSQCACDYTPDTDKFKGERIYFGSQFRGLSPVCVLGGDMVAKADHGGGLRYGFVPSLSDQENRERLRSQLL